GAAGTAPCSPTASLLAPLPQPVEDILFSSLAKMVRLPDLLERIPLDVVAETRSEEDAIRPLIVVSTEPDVPDDGPSAACSAASVGSLSNLRGICLDRHEVHVTGLNPREPYPD